MGVCFLVYYGGQWEKDSNGYHNYVGGEVTGLSVSEDSGYKDLVNILYETLELDPDRCILKLTARIPTVGSEQSSIVTLKNNMTTKFFLNYCGSCGERVGQLMLVVQDNAITNTLPVTAHDKGKRVILEEKVSSPIFRSGTRSNQISDSTPATEASPYPTTMFVTEADPVIATNAMNNLVAEVGLHNQMAGLDTLYEMNLLGSASHGGMDDNNVDPCENEDEFPHLEEAHVEEFPHINDVENMATMNDETMPTTNEDENLATPNENQIPSVIQQRSSIYTSSFDDILPCLPPVVDPSLPTRQEPSLFVKDRLNIEVGEIYESKVELRLKLASIATRKNFEFTVSRSSKDRFEAVCCQKEKGCRWRIRAIRVHKDHPFFEVRRYDESHTCEKTQLVPGHKQASTHYIGSIIKHNFEDCSSITRPRDIMKEVKQKCGVNISYKKAWRAKESALRQILGDPAASYQSLPSYFHVLETVNPGTVTRIQTDSENNFQYCFMMLGASKFGFFTSIRPVVAIDGTFLKGKYRGTLFLATCLDGNGQIFPLCIGVGDSENDESWEWFLCNLREQIGHIEGLVIVSDRHNSILKGVHNVFPNADHGFCTQHIKQNLKSTFKWDDKLLELYQSAAKEYCVSEFEALFSRILSLSPSGADYLRRVVGFDKWARSHFNYRRYSILTTNIAESINSVLRHARGLPITMLLEYFRRTMQKWFAVRREEALKHPHVLTPWAKEIIDERIAQSRSMTVSVINMTNYEVFDGYKDAIVDMQGRTCTCKVFDLDLLPCPHALAVCEFRSFVNIHVYCSEMYHTERWLHAYATSIMPLGHSSDWVIPNEVRSRIVLPPLQRVPSGRRRKQRIPSRGETPAELRRKCTRCRRYGHNRQTCRFPVPLEAPNASTRES